MTKYSAYLKFMAVFLLAVGLRFYGIKWDQGNYFHPDERFLTMVTNDLQLPDSFSEYLDPAVSKLNPYNSKYTFFVYGTFPVNFNKLIVNIFNSDDYYKIGLFGRSISAIFDLLTLLLIFLTVRIWEKFYNINSNVKYLASFFYAIAVLPIQHAHFFTVDSFLTFFMFASFYFALRSCFYNKFINAAISGILFGFAMGTKVSAVYILPLVLLLLVIDKDMTLNFKSVFKGLPVKILKCLLFAVLAYLALRLADPRFFESGNFLNFKINPKFIANIKELAGSGNYGDGLPSPPSVQWIRVPPVIFALKNIAFFGIGLPYFFIAIFGAYCLYRKKARETFFIGAWVLLFFLYQSSQFVKTMRYFYCLYPFLAILAGLGLYYLYENLKQSRTGKMIFAFAVFCILIWPYSFMQIYTKPHSRVMASEWIYKNIPENSRLAQIHWDDFLPVSLPNLHKKYDIAELPVFGPDDDSKWKTINSELEKADYIVFSSNRGYGSIGPLPDKYPQMAPFFNSLFKNKTEFKLIADIASYPTLNLGFVNIPFADQWAEEAFSVYDHPRITIFKKGGKSQAFSLNAEDKSEGMSSILSLIVWTALIQLLALAVLPYLSSIFIRYPDKAYGLSKTCGFFIFGILSWLLPVYTGVKSDSAFCFALFLVILAAGYIKAGGLSFYSRFFKEHKFQVRAVECIFLGGFLFFLGIRWANPEIFWGEKPMDSSLLHFFFRSDTLPPTDPWSSGTLMRYYYLGSYIFANFLKIADISPAIGYNLAIAIIPAFCLASLYTLFLSIIRKSGYAIFSAICVVALSNIEITNLVFLKGKGVNFDTFWASTRLFTSPGFTEYPLWSYLFADLHAHVAAQIVCAMLLTIFPAFLSTRNDKASRLQSALFGACLASLMLLNSWDFLNYMLLTFLAFLIKLIFPRKNKNFKENFIMILKEALIILAAGIIITVPYQIASNPAAGAYWGWNGDQEYNSLFMLFRHFGTWLVISVLTALLLLKKSSVSSSVSSAGAITASLISLIPIILGLCGHNRGLTPLPWSILILSSLLTLVSIFILLLNKNKSLLIKFSFLALLNFSLVLGVIEMLFLIDRMNSIFKFYYSLWMIISTAGMALTAYFFTKLRKVKLPEKIYILTSRVIISILIGLCVIGSALNIWVGIMHTRTEGPRFTLNGQAYLEKSGRDDFEIINWLNRNVIGTAVMLEAQGNSYGPFSRIVMHTGLPTVLGWEYHVKQRGTKDKEISERKEDIQKIYSGISGEEADALMEKYGVKLIIVGELERQTYPESGIKKFDANPNLFPLLFKTGSSAIYTRAKALSSKDDSDKLVLKWK